MDQVKHGTSPTTVITDRDKTLKTQPHAGDARAHEAVQKPVCDADIGTAAATDDILTP